MSRFGRLRLEHNAREIRDVWDIASWDSFSYNPGTRAYTATNIVFNDRPRVAKGEFHKSGTVFRNVDTGEEFELELSDVDLIVSQAR